MPKIIAIIGAGAAGLMAAAAIKETDAEAKVMLFEKNDGAGAKILLSGGGRCNLTNAVTDVKKLILNYPRGGKFLMSAFYRFSPDKVMSWFEEHGVPVKTENDGRVFPKSDSGVSVVNALTSYLKKNGANIFYRAEVKKIEKGDKIFKIELKDGKIFEADGVIITTGGSAYKNTGSTGDGYTFAKHFGHTITKLAPSLSSFRLADKWLAEAAGVSFENISLKLVSSGRKKIYERKGSFIFTHHGVSGPAVFALSGMAAYEEFDENSPMTLEMDFFPDKNEEELDKYVHSLTHENGKKCLINFIDIFLPKSFCHVFLDKCEISGGITAGQLTREQRLKIVSSLKKFTCEVVGRGGGDEFVTAGGVDLNEVSSSTMESKLCSDLFFAGEVLDIDGFTGGFNLQAAWATGRLAGESAAK
jgi:predicted Rossmann fold flavoprotein